MALDILTLGKNEWWGISVGISDEAAFEMASKRLGVEAEHLEMRVSGGAKLFRILENEMVVEIKQDNEHMQALDAHRQVRLQKRKLTKLTAQVDALTLLAKGCPDHPQYRAERKSKTECETCANLYRLAQEHLKGK